MHIVATWPVVPNVPRSVNVDSPVGEQGRNSGAEDIPIVHRACRTIRKARRAEEPRPAGPLSSHPGQRA